MKKLFLAGIMLLAAPFATFAQTAATGTTTVPVTATTIADPGLVPGDFFYFLDRWSEVINTALTFNKEKKARLHLEYAKERVAEVKEVLKNPQAKLADITSAKENFDTQITDAATLVKGEKEKGADVAGLARELDDELDLSRTELKDAFKEHQNNTGRAEAEIRAKIDALTAGGTATSTNVSALQGLTQALESITKEKGDAVKEEEGVDASVSDEQATFEEVMGAKMAAEKHLEQAARLRAHLEEVSGKVPEQASEQLMKQAQEAMRRGDFDAAKRMSKDAEHGLENAEINATTNSGTMMSSQESGNIDTGHLDNLERGIKESERMMQGLGAEQEGNETNTTNR